MNTQSLVLRSSRDRLRVSADSKVFEAQHKHSDIQLLVGTAGVGAGHRAPVIPAGEVETEGSQGSQGSLASQVSSVNELQVQ